jgi:hypothetical protein
MALTWIFKKQDVGFGLESSDSKCDCSFGTCVNSNKLSDSRKDKEFLG